MSLFNWLCQNSDQQAPICLQKHNNVRHMESSINPPSGLVSRSVLFGLAVLGAGMVFISQASAADPGKIVVQVDKAGAKISPMLYGIMTEEINYSYDGGLYGELIQNRIFKNPAPRGGRGRRGGGADAAPAAAPAIAHWAVVSSEGAQGAISLDTTDPVNTIALTTSLKLNISSVSSGGRVGVANDGFWGIPVFPNTTYTASFYAKASEGFSGPLTVDIESNDGKVFATATVPAVGSTWQKYNVALKTSQLEPTAAARFVVSGGSKGTLNFNLVSLFPPTYKNRPNGNRVDLSQLLADMKPAFLRFPGGNYVEGSDFANRFDWQKTIGPLEERPTHMSPWGYRSSDGMGLMEFLGWCEDINMEPVLAVWAGLCLDNGRSVVTGDALKPFIQEALDEIEYITGDVSTKWGARRAKDGHPAPFKLTYVEIGNEDFLNNGTATYRGPEGRFALFYNAIKAKYPNLQIIATTNPNSTHDVIDEHFYMNYNDAMTRAHMYDPSRRPRTTSDGKPAPKVFVGEWATRDNNPTPAFHCALTDAAFLTGLERNSDLVIMSGYAPLLVNVNPGGQQWATDLIGYNTLVAFGSPSYYVQKMFYNSRGDVILPIALTPQLAPPAPTPAPATTNAAAGPGRGRGRGQGGPPPYTMFASSSREEATGDIILKVVNVLESPQSMEISLEGAPTIGKTAKLEVLTGALTDINSPAEPMKVAPKSSTIDASAKFVREFPGYTVNVIRFSTK
jgi:alpha-L-arabinofuranosidase